MEVMPLRSYRLEFAKRAADRREDERRIIDQIKDREERDKKREHDVEADQDALIDIVAAVLATDAQIADFTVKLDTYDAATVEALMENEQALERVRDEIRIMLDKAYVLPDGRRVFKTEDGTRIFDEHGEEVTDFDPDEIEDWRPRYEGYKAIVAEEEALVEERNDLIEYQDLLDDTRERAGQEGLTNDELDELEQRLEANMPDAVKRQLPKESALGLDEASPDAEPQATAFRPAGKLDMPAL